eukprot:UN27469
METQMYAWLVSGVGTSFAVLGTLSLIVSHYRSYTNPTRQFYFIVILCMVPLFSVSSFIGILDITAEEWEFTLLDSIKECYEAVVIHYFLKLLYDYMEINLNPKRSQRHL